MITVTAGYTSGDRDVHANGLRIAVCSLLADTAFQAQIDCARDMTGPGGERVVYRVELTDRERAVRFFRELARRGMCPEHQTEILYETPADSATLALAEVYTREPNVHGPTAQPQQDSLPQAGPGGGRTGRPVD